MQSASNIIFLCSNAAQENDVNRCKNAKQTCSANAKRYAHSATMAYA